MIRTGLVEPIFLSHCYHRDRCSARATRLATACRAGATLNSVAARTIVGASTWFSWRSSESADLWRIARLSQDRIEVSGWKARSRPGPPL